MPEDMWLAFCRRWKGLPKSDSSRLLKLTLRWTSLGWAGYSLAPRLPRGLQQLDTWLSRFPGPVRLFAGVNGDEEAFSRAGEDTGVSWLCGATDQDPVAAGRVFGLTTVEDGEGPGSAQRKSDFFSHFSPPGPRSPLGPPCARCASRVCPLLDPSSPTSRCCSSSGRPGEPVRSAVLVTLCCESR